MKKFIMLLLTMFMCLSSNNIAVAANVAIVLDVPTAIYTNVARLASIDKTPFKNKFPAGSVFKTARECVAATKDYRIKNYNAEMDASRHNGYFGYKNEFTPSDLKGIAEAEKCDYVMFIKSYGIYENVNIATSGIIKTKALVTRLKLHVKAAVFNAKTGAFENEEKITEEMNDRTVLSYKSSHDNLYYMTFDKAMKNLGR